MGRVKELYIEITSEYGEACSFCGEKDLPLELCHLMPISQGGTNSPDNFRLICPQCHKKFDARPKEIDFINYLSQLLEASNDFKEVKRDILLGEKTRYRADLFAKRKERDLWKKNLIECKSNSSFNTRTILAIRLQLETYAKLLPEPDQTQLVLAIPGRCSEASQQILKDHGIELWDIDYLSSVFSNEIGQVPHLYYQHLFATVKRTRELSYEKKLIKELKECMPGRKDCYVYQKLIGTILEHLFTPPLEKPISEHSDAPKVNRRDFIVPNYTAEGFWAFLRSQYKADYLIIDAKNYKNSIKKASVLQMANYLKPHGSGLFGIIFTREGGDSRGCMHTVREQWMSDGKMIVILNDEDVENMLLAKSSGGDPTEVIGKKIENFRLSM